MCEEMANAYVCVLLYIPTPCPLYALKWRKKAVLAYWDGGGLLTALPITVSLFTHMQMYEKCSESNEMRGWVGLPRVVGMVVHV